MTARPSSRLPQGTAGRHRAHRRPRRAAAGTWHLDPRQIASQAAAPLHQASALVSGCGISWNAQSDEALLAQANASAQAARAFAQFLLPVMGDLGGRLAAPGARMLDIGTGVGALAAGFAEAFP